MGHVKAKKVQDAVDDNVVEKLISDLSRYTQQNNVSEAMMLLATALKATKLVKICKALDDIINAEGSMPRELDAYRRQVMGTLFKLAEQKWGKEIGKRIYKSF